MARGASLEAMYAARAAPGFESLTFRSGGETGGQGVSPAGVRSARHPPWKVNPPGAGTRSKRAGRREPLGIRASAFRSWTMNPPGCGRRPEPGWARKRWESCSPSSA